MINRFFIKFKINFFFKDKNIKKVVSNYYKSKNYIC